MINFSTLPFDIVQHTLFYLSYHELIDFLDTPLSKTFVQLYGTNSHLWKNLCRLEPWSISHYTLERYCTNPRKLCHQIKRVEEITQVHPSLEHDNQPTVHRLLDQLTRLSFVPHVQLLLLPYITKLNEDDSNRLFFQQSGGIEQLLAIMSRYETMAEIQASVCHAIVTAIRPMGRVEGSRYYHHEDQNSPADLVGQHQGIPLILKAMTLHPDNAQVQTNGCWSIVNLALSKIQKRALIEHDAISIITKALRRHPKVQSVQFRAIFALVNLVAAQDARVIFPSDFLSLILDQAMTRFSTDETIVKLGLMVIGNLVTQHHHLLANEENSNDDPLTLKLLKIVQDYNPDHTIHSLVNKTIDRIINRRGR